MINTHESNQIEYMENERQNSHPYEKHDKKNLSIHMLGVKGSNMFQRAPFNGLNNYFREEENQILVTTSYCNNIYDNFIIDDEFSPHNTNINLIVWGRN